ncbi:unannotated protein [freshwater metagenome]|uniref:Unannotated protein n=1 Tax=freshwater metagenome TaxID=449393 RepID=A0A6J6SV50_9ZZZZ
MYSPKGTGCILMYRSPGPVTGSQTMPVFQTPLGLPGTSTTAPTMIGAPTA